MTSNNFIGAFRLRSPDATKIVGEVETRITKSGAKLNFVSESGTFIICLRKVEIDMLIEDLTKARRECKVDAQDVTVS